MRRLFIPAILLFLCIGHASAGIFDSIQKGFDMMSTTSDATQKAARPISDEEEYYLGRAVAARILQTYPLMKEGKLTEYVNTVGTVLALHSEKPYTYGGYHFAILDSDEMNAFACPGGTIFITKGMLMSASTEDELAAILAHEIAHISHRDGISSIKKSRWTEATAIIGSKAAQNYGPQQLSQLTGIFEGSVDDIVKTLVVRGYGKTQEYDADKAALIYLSGSGYNPEALKDVLERMVSSGKGSEGGIMKTHPGTTDRIDNIRADIPRTSADPGPLGKRTGRFTALLH
ncbi:MAG: peptidase M48 [Nitrospirae bacterium]|nr:peptidase M48 [Nitrospirota bacterium]